MALLHQATLTPTKLDLAVAWLPTRSWVAGQPTDEIRQVGSFRFDDPDGEVGVETLLLVTPSGVFLQVPFTYRAAPLAGAREHLVGTMEHSVLGTRWVYDGPGDPVWARVVVAAITGGASSADELVDTPAGLVPRTPTASAHGTGGAAVDVAGLDVLAVDDESTVTRVTTSLGTVELLRVLDPVAGADGEGSALVGGWQDGPEGVVLARFAAQG